MIDLSKKMRQAIKGDKNPFNGFYEEEIKNILEIVFYQKEPYFSLIFAASKGVNSEDLSFELLRKLPKLFYEENRGIFEYIFNQIAEPLTEEGITVIKYFNFLLRSNKPLLSLAFLINRIKDFENLELKIRLQYAVANLYPKYLESIDLNDNSFSIPISISYNTNKGVDAIMNYFDSIKGNLKEIHFDELEDYYHSSLVELLNFLSYNDYINSVVKVGNILSENRFLADLYKQIIEYPEFKVLKNRLLKYDKLTSQKYQIPNKTLPQKELSLIIYYINDTIEEQVFDNNYNLNLLHFIYNYQRESFYQIKNNVRLRYLERRVSKEDTRSEEEEIKQYNLQMMHLNKIFRNGDTLVL